MNRRELEMHLQDLFEGCLGKEAFVSLQDELRTNPEARDTYREYLLLHHSLQYRSKGVDLLHVVPMDQVNERRQRRLMKHAGLAAAAVLLLGALVMALVLSNPGQATLTFTASPGTDLVVSHRIDGENLPDGQGLEPGSRLVLKHGAVELEFASGVRGILRGPADITLLREDLLDLAHGTAWFHVPKKAIGFQVRTPDLVLTDLGTEFGLLSKANAPAEVHVFTGKVEVLNRHGLKHSEVIEAGQARVAGPAGRWTATNPRRDHFLEKLPRSVSAPIGLDDSVTFTSSPGNQIMRQVRYAFASDAALSGFDPGKSDKLVATFSHENSSITEVTYGGVRMSPAVISKTAGRLQTSIYYLDSPGTAGDLVVNFGGASNGVGGSLLALSNTAPGKPVVTAEGGEVAPITTSVINAFLVVSHVSNDPSATAKATARAPLKPLFDGPVGSAVGGTGYLLVKSRNTLTPTFSGTVGSPITVAAAFAPQP